MTPQPPSSEAPAAHPRRVLLKLSGEVFGGGAVGLDPDVVSDAARQIAEAVVTGVQVAVVVGGGNFFRGAELSQSGMARDRADYMGMLGTVMNALALQDFIEKAGVPARVQSAIAMTQVAEPYIPLRAIRHLEKGRVVVTWRRGGSSSSAPVRACPTSPPIPSPPSGRWRPAATSSSWARTASTASTRPIRARTRRPGCSAA